jgi:outer membrane protein assembly factor BamB/orotate phosphoribosyltransferase
VVLMQLFIPSPCTTVGLDANSGSQNGCDSRILDHTLDRPMTDLEHQFKHFLLNKCVSIGGKSTSYNEIFDIRRLLLSGDSTLIRWCAEQLWHKIQPWRPNVLVSRGVGGLPLLPLLQRAAQDVGYNVSTLYVRKSRKTYGLKHIVEGPLNSELVDAQAVFVDDLLGQCRNFAQAKKVLEQEEYQLKWVGAACIFDLRNMPGTRQLMASGTPVASLISRPQLNITRHDADLLPLIKHTHWHRHSFHAGQDFMEWKGAPAVHDGCVYVANDNTSFWCFDLKSGAELWHHVSRRPQLKGGLSIPVFYQDQVLWTAYDGTVRSHDQKTGNLNWICHYDTAIHSTPAVCHKQALAWIGTEWFKHGWDRGGFGLGDVVCIDLKNGHERWRTPTGGMIPSSPAFSSVHNLVVVGSNDFHVRALNATTGQVVWSVPTWGEFKGKAVFDNSQHSVVFQTVKGMVYAVNMITGTVLWQGAHGQGSLHSWPVIYDHSVLVTNSACHLIKLCLHTGERQAIARFRSRVHWGPTLWNNGLLAQTDGGQLFLLDPHNLKKIAGHTWPTKPKLVQPPAVSGDVAVLASNDQGIFCVELNQF